jgi:cell division protein FtsB
MKRFKQFLLRAFLMSEVIVFTYMYIFGAQGLRSMWAIKAECNELEERIALLHQDVAVVESNILAWQHDPFYKEKMAREKLGMARSDERVFIVN